MENLMFRKSFMIFLSLSVLLMNSCQKGVCISELSSDMSEIVDYDTAVKSFEFEKNGRTFFVDRNEIYTFFKQHYPKERIKQIKPYVYNRDSVFYAVNLESGWKIISADTRTVEVLAYNDKGSISFKDDSNPEFLLLINNWAEQISHLRNVNLEEKKDLTKKQGQRSQILWKKELYSSVITNSSDVEYITPLLLTEWGQGFPWNYKCPYIWGYGTLYTGCVAVALSQIIYYNNIVNGVPSGLFHTIDCTNFLFDGDHYIANVLRSDYCDPSPRWSEMPWNSSGFNTDYVGDLMMDVGDRVNMVYYPFGSYSNMALACNALNYYGLTGNTSSGNYDIIRIKENLSNARPLFISALVTGGAYYGHAWVLDGYKKTRIERTDTYIYLVAGPYDFGELFTTEELHEMYPDEKIEDGMMVCETSISDLSYLHMNWGYDGNSNGFFYEGPLAVWDVMNTSFSSNKQLIYDIRPVE